MDLRNQFKEGEMKEIELQGLDYQKKILIANEEIAAVEEFEYGTSGGGRSVGTIITLRSGKQVKTSSDIQNLNFQRNR